MKRTTIYLLIIINLLLGLAIEKILLRTKSSSNNNSDRPSLKQLTSLIITNNSNQQNIKFIKSQRTKQWTLSDTTFEWPANNSALEHLINETYNKTDNINYDNSISITANDGSRTWHWVTNIDLNDNINDDNWAYTIMEYYLDNHIVLDSLNNCKIFKIDNEDNEFIFAKHGKHWYLASPSSDMIADNHNILTFFQTLSHIHSNKILATKQLPMRPNLSIKFYNDTSSQTISFLVTDDKIYTNNNKANIGCSISQDDWDNIQKSIQSLLTFNIFSMTSCHDIDITLSKSYEQFTFHDIKEYDRCQFTHVINGTLNVYELPHQEMESLIDFLRTIQSLSITTLPTGHSPSFIIKVNNNDNNKIIFAFHNIGQQLFVTINEHLAAFEIPAYFTPILFHKIRSHTVTPGNLL